MAEDIEGDKLIASLNTGGSLRFLPLVGATWVGIADGDDENDGNNRNDGDDVDHAGDEGMVGEFEVGGRRL